MTGIRWTEHDEHTYLHIDLDKDAFGKHTQLACGYVGKTYWGLFYKSVAYTIPEPNKTKQWFRNKQDAQTWLLWQFTYAIWSAYMRAGMEFANSETPIRREIAKLHGRKHNEENNYNNHIG